MCMLPQELSVASRHNKKNTPDCAEREHDLATVLNCLTAASGTDVGLALHLRADEIHKNKNRSDVEHPMHNDLHLSIRATLDVWSHAHE